MECYVKQKKYITHFLVYYKNRFHINTRGVINKTNYKSCYTTIEKKRHLITESTKTKEIYCIHKQKRII